MTEKTPVEQDQSKDADEFASQAEQQSDNIVVEFWYFLRYNKKWWLTPIIVMMLFMGLIVVSFNSPLAPFLYTLF
jgi:hypothetical protein